VSFYCWGKATLAANKRTSVAVVTKPRLPKDLDQYALRDVAPGEDTIPRASVAADPRADTRALFVTSAKDVTLPAGAFLCTATTLELKPLSKRPRLVRLEAAPDVDVEAGAFWQARCSLPELAVPKSPLKMVKLKADATMTVMAEEGQSFQLERDIGLMVAAKTFLPAGRVVYLGYASIMVAKDVREEKREANEEKRLERERLIKEKEKRASTGGDRRPSSTGATIDEWPSKKANSSKRRRRRPKTKTDKE